MSAVVGALVGWLIGRGERTEEEDENLIKTLKILLVVGVVSVALMILIPFLL